MAVELTTIACPSCGAALQISASTVVVLCPHCGNEHSIRRAQRGSPEASLTRCPQCGRNDKVEKVSAIVASQTHTTEGEMPVTETWTDSEGKTKSHTTYEKFTRVQTSALAKQLAPPEKPASPNAPSLIWPLAFAACTVFAGVGAFVLVMEGDDAACLAPFLFVGSALATWMSDSAYKRSKREYPNRLSAYQAELNKHNHAVRRYEGLYYCSRDDCVFVLGDGVAAPISQLKQHLYEEFAS